VGNITKYQKNSTHSIEIFINKHKSVGNFTGKDESKFRGKEQYSPKLASGVFIWFFWQLYIVVDDLTPTG